ncbi:hypothetical protein IE81DRAFT_322552 [Ceraceosorus guamensis]|uniref:Heme-dependent catalase n=1 Tax=Ceraceosorus guamensis TaxID=1522189 RepID=A0A316W0F4_9BASI|nr:hypothetical protein IE81DRAFT_322552 [Ceraceosorus guamensis]PWN43260.1 hypothetical protein IE81DRAFT_322552 [Ceraceosorus guamensis]
MTSSSARFIRWDAPGVDSKSTAEEENLIKQVEEQINESQRRVFECHRRAFSGTHVKTQGVVKGTITVPSPDASTPPSEYAQGFFSKSGTYQVHLRYSTETTDLIDDRVPQPRGIGLKIFGVEGAKLGDVDAKTQDFEFNSAPAIELGTARVCRDILALRLEHGHDAKELDGELKKRDDYEVQDSRNHIPNIHLVSQVQYSQSAFRHGEYVAKHRLVPSSAAQEAAKREVKPEHKGNTILRDWLQEYYKSNEATYDFQVQLLENIQEQAVEDNRNGWDEDKYPFVTVAKLNIPPQESFAIHRVRFHEQELIINPWYGLEAHKPLGSLNRLRKGVYAASRRLRGGLNGSEPKHVSDINQIPDN